MKKEANIHVGGSLGSVADLTPAPKNVRFGHENSDLSVDSGSVQVSR